MFIHNMTEAECRQVLKAAQVGRLACAQGNQPYIVPIYFAYSEHHLYAISTLGQKIEWMRANPLVCLQVDELTSNDEWMSVIVFRALRGVTGYSRVQIRAGAGSRTSAQTRSAIC